MTKSRDAPTVREQALEEARDSNDLYSLLQGVYYLDGDGYVLHAEQIDHTTVPELSVNVEEISDREQVEHLLELADTAGWVHISTTPERHRLTFRQRVSDSERREDLLRCDYCHWMMENKGAEPTFSSNKSRWGCSEQHLRAAQQETAREFRAALQEETDE